MTSAIPFSTVLMHIPERTASIHGRPHDLHKAVDKAYITALLLTASAKRAEAALLAATRAAIFDSAPGEVLIRGAVNAAVEPPSETSEQLPEDLEHASSMLPFELRRVLHLSQALRQCFVLRFLVGLPREVCARLLHLEIRQVDERARAAMSELPTMRNRMC